MMPKRSLASDRMRREGGHSAHIRRVAVAEPKPKYKERVLSRARSAPQVIQ